MKVTAKPPVYTVIITGKCNSFQRLDESAITAIRNTIPGQSASSIRYAKDPVTNNPITILKSSCEYDIELVPKNGGWAHTKKPKDLCAGQTAVVIPTTQAINRLKKEGKEVYGYKFVVAKVSNDEATRMEWVSSGQAPKPKLQDAPLTLDQVVSDEDIEQHNDGSVTVCGTKFDSYESAENHFCSLSKTNDDVTSLQQSVPTSDIDDLLFTNGYEIQATLKISVKSATDAYNLIEGLKKLDSSAEISLKV